MDSDSAQPRLQAAPATPHGFLEVHSEQRDGEVIT